MTRALLLSLFLACGAPPVAQTATQIPSPPAKPTPSVDAPAPQTSPFEGEIEYVTEKELHEKCSTCPKVKTLERYKGTKFRMDEEQPPGFGSGVTTSTYIADSATGTLFVLQPDNTWLDVSSRSGTSTSTSTTIHDGTETSRTEVIAGEPCRVWVRTSGDYREEICWSKPLGKTPVALKTEHYQSNQLTERKTVLRIERKSIPDDVFVVGKNRLGP